MDNVGELLLNMFRLCKEHNVSITFDISDISNINIYMQRDRCRVRKMIDPIRTYQDPEEVLEFIFHDALCNLNYYMSKEENK